MAGGLTDETNSNGAAVAIAKDGVEPVWFNPLKESVVRWQTNELGGLQMARRESGTFGVARDNFTGLHQGLDILAEPNVDECIAVANGVLTTIGAPIHKENSFGLVLLLEVLKSDLPTRQRKHFDLLCPEHDKVYFAYCHCSSVVKELVSQPVKAGMKIGTAGNTGNAGFLLTKAKGAHVHFEVRMSKTVGSGLEGRLDPMPFIEDLVFPKGKFPTWNPFYPHDVPEFYKDKVYHYQKDQKYEKRGENEFWTGKGRRSYSTLTSNETELFKKATISDVHF